ncbi:MAG: hypothetical protein RL681_362 [Candidatus Parcubacteria bacterium]|jgi:uncharacterized protein YggE
MNTKIKDVFGVAAALAILALGWAATRYVDVYSSSIEPATFRSFTVSGEGKVVVVPDVAQIWFSVLTDGGKDLTALQTKNTENVNKAIAFVKAQGVKAEDIKTESYSIDPRYQSYKCGVRALPMAYPAGTSGTETSVAYPAEPAPCPPPDIVGYSIHQSISVKVRDFKKIGDILSGVVDAGANTVNGPSFIVDDPTKSRNDAREEAIKKAQQSAEEISHAAGFGLGRLLGIDEGGNYPLYYEKAYGRGGGVAMDAAAAPAPTIEPGSQDITVTVTLRYEIR